MFYISINFTLLSPLASVYPSIAASRLMIHRLLLPFRDISEFWYLVLIDPQRFKVSLLDRIPHSARR